MEKQNNDVGTRKYSPWSVGAFFFVGCMFLGMGIGQIMGDRQIGMYFGMGVGMIAFGVVSLMNSKK